MEVGEQVSVFKRKEMSWECIYGGEVSMGLPSRLGCCLVTTVTITSTYQEPGTVPSAFNPHNNPI